MYKMLIVDDEYLVLLGIKETIDWEKYGIKIIGEATNGQEGYEKAMELKPDIIITDVKMPIMNGISLVEKLNKASFDGAIIILSGYSDFEYAKRAFESGVYAYVLKPIDNQELIDTVLNSLSKLNERRKTQKLLADVEEQMPVLKAKTFQDLLEGNFESDESITDKLRLHEVPVINDGYVVYGHLDNDTENEVLADLHRIIKEKLMNADILHCDNLFPSYFVFIVNCNDVEFLKYLLTESLLKYEEEHAELFSVGVSERFEGIRNIPDAYKVAVKASAIKIFAAMNTVNFSDDKVNNYNKSIRSALEIISENYNENLTVGMVAEKLYVSESYLMHLFKDTLGMTFNECLTNYRIMMAKRLLLKGNYRVNEVAHLVGYGDVKYFGQVFKRIVGFTPSEFLKQHSIIGERYAKK